MASDIFNVSPPQWLIDRTNRGTGWGGIGGTLLGALLMGVINNGLDLLNVSSYYQQIVKGVIIVGAVWLDRRQNPVIVLGRP